MQHSRALKPGTFVARDWRIERLLGQGGFGVTYEARHRASGETVALKEYMPSGLCTRVEGSTKITPSQGPAEDVFKRGLSGFLKEAETLARLDHPSIVKVSSYFEANDTAYMALAYETGGTLADWLKRLGRSPTQAELDALLWPLFDALIQVHSLPLLHRDIKPENIMLRGDGTPVLIDFGAVKNLVSSDSRSIHGPATLNFVTDGYAPPEQYVGDGDALLGPWSDVYALGATVYEAVTGARPASATRRMVDENHRPLADLALDHVGPGWRPAFLEGVDKALSLKRSNRPQSMVEFRRAIGLNKPSLIAPPVLGSQSGTHTPPIGTAKELTRPVTFNELPGTPQLLKSGPRSMATLGIVAGLAFLLLAAGAWWVAQEHTPGSNSAVLKAETDRRSAEAAQIRTETEARRSFEEKARAETNVVTEPAARRRSATEARESIFMQDSRVCAEYCRSLGWCTRTSFSDGKCQLFQSPKADQAARPTPPKAISTANKPLFAFYTATEMACRSYCSNEPACLSWSFIGSQCYAFADRRTGQTRK